ncbi:MAG TPA: hypothetical protein ENK19_02805 [Acidobacteria bacterium]|nr:hypothetical protein [Acidobacteriota bacterium]
MNELETILDRCLDEILAGATVAECLERHPGHREELEPLLETSAVLQELPRAQPSPSAASGLLVRAGTVLAEGEPSGELPAAARSHGGRILSFRLSRPVRQLVLGLAAVMVLLVLGGASADTVPGDLFYPVKLARERVSFALTTRPDHRAELRLDFADRRLGELVEMAGTEGRIDPGLIQRLLRQGSLALKDARTLPEDRLELFLKKLELFNAYERQVLEQVAPRVHASQRPMVQRAIEMCGERGRWMRRASPESLKSSPPPQDSCWGDRCGGE